MNKSIFLSQKLFRSKIFWFVVILIEAAFFRIFFLDLIEFKTDEAITVFQTVQFYLDPHIIQRGLISGIGVYNFPLFNYLIILLSVFSRDPQHISFLIALINTLLVPIFFLIIRRYYDQVTAVFAAFLLAFSPWAIIYSRKIWAQDLILLLLIPFFALLHELILKKKYQLTMPIFIILVLLSQLHASGIFLSAATVIIIILLRVKINPWQALTGVLIGTIVSLPYIVFQFTSYPQCPDCEAFFKYQSSARSYDIYNFIRPFQLMNGQGYHFVLGNSYDGFIASFPLLKYVKYFFLSSFIIPLMGVFYIVTKKREYLFLVLYLLIIPPLYFVTRTIPYMHYFVILIPIIATLYALSFSSAYYLLKTRFLKALVIISFAVFVIGNIIFLYSFYQYLSVTKVIQGDYGPIFSLTKQTVDQRLQDYRDVKYYDELQSYTYVILGSKDFNEKLSSFFTYYGDTKFAQQELEQQAQEVIK